jgi:hypothetical protein
LSDRIRSFLSDLDRVSQLDPEAIAECVQRARWIRGATADEIQRLFRDMADRDALPDGPQDALLNAALQHVMARQRGLVPDIAALTLDRETLSLIACLYGSWTPAVTSRCQLLFLLAGSRQPEALRAFAEAVATDPPSGETWVGPAFGPLFQHRDYRPEDLFPRLLDGLSQPSAAAAILDLANFVTREGLVPAHPAASRCGELITLLAGLVGRLGQLEAEPPEDRAALLEMTRQVNAGVSLGVTLCDALGLIRDQAAVGKLYQAMELGHRRLRTEAAAALARLGERGGTDALVALAEEPVARLRVLAYADELGFLEQIEPRFQTDVARAEAELAVWLSSPNQMGLPPSDCELVDQRELLWPSFAEPVTCYLFRFSYRIGDQEFTNLGLAGPMSHAFPADLSDLPRNDVFAAFAGWQVAHEEIYEVDAERWGDAERIRAAQLERHLRDRGYDALRPMTLAAFFGDSILVAEATHEGRAGVVAASLTDACWSPRGEGPRPLGPVETLCILKGRRLLRTFNPEVDPPAPE